jgi:pimeloyl-ACP methyl ester carboxylesterase
MNPACKLVRLTLALGGVALGSAAISAARLVEEQAGVPAELCSFNRVVLAPSARSAVIWHDDGLKMAGSQLRRRPNAFVMIPLTDSEANARPRIFRTDRSLSAFRWSKDGEALEALVERVGLIRIRGGEPPHVRHDALPNSWGPVRVVSQSHGSLEEQLRDYTTSLPGPGPTYSMKTAFLDDQVTLVAADPRSDFSLVALTPQGARPAAISAFSVYDLTKIGTMPLRLGFAGSETSPPGTAVATSPHRRAIIDLESGKPVGFYTPVSVVDLAGRRLVDKSGLNGFVKHVSASGRSLAILHADASGRHWLTVQNRGQVRHHLLCSSAKEPGSVRPPSEGAPRPARIEQVLLDGLGAAAGSTGYLIGGGPTQAKSLIIRFHGGPLATVIDGFPTKSTRELAATGHDLLELDSASAIAIGPVAEGALRSSGPETLEQSADSALKWASGRGYDRIYVVGESFGGAQAMFAARKFPQLVRGAYLLAPLASFDPDLTLGGRSTALPLQAAFEQRAIGGAENRRRLRDWLRELFTGRCPSGPVRVFAGARDPVAPPDALPDCLRSPKTASLTILPKDHAGLFEAEQVWRSIRGDISESVSLAEKAR